MRDHQPEPLGQAGLYQPSKPAKSHQHHQPLTDATILASLQTNPNLLQTVLASINQPQYLPLRPEKELASPVSQRESRFHVTQKQKEQMGERLQLALEDSEEEEEIRQFRKF